MAFSFRFDLASGPKQCYECVGNNQFTNCSRPEHLRSQSCATGLSSLGTTHCGSVVGKYQDGNGNIVDGSFRGCIDCAGRINKEIYQIINLNEKWNACCENIPRLENKLKII